MREPKVVEIWLATIPLLSCKEDGTFDAVFQIRPFLIVDDGKGVMIEENPDYLASKITTKENRISKLKEIENWKELGLNQKSFVRIEIPERLERNQLINKITVIHDAQFIEFYKEIISLFNVDIMQSILSSNMVCQ